MVRTLSTMEELGTPAPSFQLPDISGAKISLEDFAGSKALMVAFMCNHCPYVKHIQQAFAKFASEFQEKGLAVIAISSNDADNYPDDGPDKMAEESRNAGYTFPYLYDESQAVAKAYHAACTPDFFLYDEQRNLVYRGQFDGSRPKNDIPVTGEDMRRAVNALLAGNPVPREQIPSMGCNIKWKPGNEPDYFSS
jgi:peroxiredoxin